MITKSYYRYLCYGYALSFILLSFAALILPHIVHGSVNTKWLWRVLLPKYLIIRFMPYYLMIFLCRYPFFYRHKDLNIGKTGNKIFLFLLSVLICSQLLMYKAAFYLMAKMFYSAAPFLLDWSKFISYLNIVAKFIIGLVLVIFSNIFMNRISVKKTTTIDSNKIFAVCLLLLVFTDYVLTQFMAPFGYESFRIIALSFFFIPWPRFVAWLISMTLIYFIFRGNAFISDRISWAGSLTVFVTGICLFTVSGFMYNIYTLFIEKPGFDINKLLYVPFGILLLSYPLYQARKYSEKV